MGEIIRIRTEAGTAQAYFALSTRPSAPGVLLIHAWWGLNDFFQALADRLAREGFTVLAPDYLDGGVASTIDEAKELRTRLDRKIANKIISESSSQLLADTAVVGSRIGVVGFSLGCGFALEVARSRPRDVGAVVLFYGTGGGKFDRVRAPILGHFAEDDQWGANSKKVISLEKRFGEAGVEFEFHTYQDTKHWFFEADRPDAFNADAADQALQSTVAFLRNRVGQ